MKTKIGTAFGIILLLVMGVIGAMLALGMFQASEAEASIAPPAAAEQMMPLNTQTVVAAIDLGGGTSTLNDRSTGVVTVLSTFALGGEGFGPVPRHPLIKPIAPAGNLITTVSLNQFVTDAYLTTGAGFHGPAHTNNLATAAPTALA